MTVYISRLCQAEEFIIVYIDIDSFQALEHLIPSNLKDLLFNQSPHLIPPPLFIFFPFHDQKKLDIKKNDYKREQAYPNQINIIVSTQTKRGCHKQQPCQCTSKSLMHIHYFAFLKMIYVCNLQS